jgi:hypothetical protein
MATRTCARCGGSIGLPHLSEVDCVRELDREMAATVRQLRALNERRSLAADISGAQTRFAGSLGLRTRRPSLLAARRVGQNERED